MEQAVQLQGPLGALAGSLVGGFATVAGAVVMVVMGWQFLKVLFTGGSERALVGVGKTLLVLAVAVAALNNLPAVAGLVLAVGQALVAAAVQAVQGSLQGAA
jgi:hypothetical protein